jgi:hypothetical protein
MSREVCAVVVAKETEKHIFKREYELLLVFDISGMSSRTKKTRRSFFTWHCSTYSAAVFSQVSRYKKRPRLCRFCLFDTPFTHTVHPKTALLYSEHSLNARPRISLATPFQHLLLVPLPLLPAYPVACTEYDAPHLARDRPVEKVRIVSRSVSEQMEEPRRPRRRRHRGYRGAVCILDLMRQLGREARRGRRRKS